jgi:hypothetical protein
LVELCQHFHFPGGAGKSQKFDLQGFHFGWALGMSTHHFDFIPMKQKKHLLLLFLHKVLSFSVLFYGVNSTSSSSV